MKEYFRCCYYVVERDTETGTETVIAECKPDDGMGVYRPRFTLDRENECVQNADRIVRLLNGDAK